jgi:hypothetical protein
MSVSTFNEIIKYTESLTLDEQLQLAAYLIEKARQTPTWQNMRGLVAFSTLGKEANKPPVNRWQAFFESTERLTEDFMQERIDLPPQTREIF